MFVHPDAKETLAVLDSLSIPYRYYNHDLARTMADCADIGADVGARHFKNLFLTDRKKSVFVLLLLCPEKEFRTSDISKQLGTSRLSFTTAEQMTEYLGLVPGSVTPMALARESAKNVRVAIDRDILSMETVCAHPCTAEASVALSKDDLFRFLAHCGNDIAYVDA
ncbi:MAG: prolyl-tRNA synthetase associated domain-containing protein [Clostridiales bacterium]|nr:prolyl-tRNA synthetase associated domain-containing protein [Clostridiales bacterium]